MAWTPLLFPLFILCTGLCAVPVLTQTPSASSSLGGSAKLTCTLSSEHSTYYIEWYQQRVGQAPRYLMKLTSDGSVTKGDGIPDRFSGSSSGADRYLTIANIQSEDETEYICGVNYNTDGQAVSLCNVFGGGTKLTVLGQPKSSPSVTLFAPSNEELNANKATLVCLINDFYPGSVTVAWKSGSTTITKGVETSQPSKQSNSKYAASSYLALTASEWKSYEKGVSCQVTHDGKTVEKTVSPSECP
ncbi:immunoglobulin lambda-1 light chain-like [Lagenorhynchus albirostris]|uniref:immunoglobulin lambda-1 light chain-like n=1 Tax=Lagenorhynchus albirostris TaxID=27610 RepID=UPI0028EEC803|nr:immunoglobulin lambda-1 light chain-like [Lagenorhynchus albirostris]